MIRSACFQCGLPVAVSQEPCGAAVFCCHGCRIAAAIVGTKAGGEDSWHLLRLAAAGLLSMSVMMIALLLYTGNVEPDAAAFFRFVMLALSTLSLAVSLPPFITGALGEVRSGRLAVDTLIVGGALAAFGVSAANTFIDRGPVYFDTATMLPVFLAFGRLIETSAKTRSTRLLQSLDDLLPRSALLVAEDGSLREVPPAELQPGDLIRVRPGERVAADGRVEEGSSMFEEAQLTGEPMPRFHGMGDELFAGAVNGAGSILMRVIRVGDDLFISRIAESVALARLTAAPWDRIAQKAAAVFVPVTLAVAIISGIGWWLAGSEDLAVNALLSVLVVACPCALGIATPLATSQAISRAAGKGILVRGGDILERVGAIDLLFLDKTGTLTSGRPEVVDVVVLDQEVTEDELIQWTASLEAGTGHVFANAVLAAAAKRGLTLGGVKSLVLLPGGGVSASVTLGRLCRRIIVGRMAGRGDACDAEATTGFDVSWEGKLRGRILISDRLREEVPEVIARLSAMGIETILISGDGHAAAEAAARQAGISGVEARRSPAEKAHLVKSALSGGRKVAMVGDGVNDAPALAEAGVGIALGGGADLVRLAGHVVLLADNVADIPWLVALSRQTRRIIIENLGWAFCYNAIAVTAAAAGVLHPLLAAVAMVASSLSVIVNSSRIRKFPDSLSERRLLKLKSPSETAKR